MTLESCTGYRERLEALHDDELPLDEQLALQEHLAHCAGCAYEFQALERLRISFHDIPPALGTRQAAPPESFAGNQLEPIGDFSNQHWLQHAADFDGRRQFR